MSKKFIPSDFVVPEILETATFKLRMLKLSDVVKDYDAVMSSVEHLLKSKPFGPTQKWPVGLTIEQNLIDLGWHQKEFQMRSTFAYTVMNLDESTCLGCVYIEASPYSTFDVVVYLWARQSEIQNGLDELLYQTVKSWIDKVWPLKKVGYPGRSISWEEWKSQPK